MKPYVTIDGKKYPATETEKTLKYIGGLWRRNAWGMLRRHKKNASGSLKKSMRIEVGHDAEGPYVDITPKEPYWYFVDQGVRGAETSPFPRQRNSPFRFKKKRPPSRVIKRWLKDKGIKPRDAEGRFVSFDSVAFLIARSIWSRGLRPSFFISDTGDRIKSKYLNKIGEAMAEDYQNAFTKHMKENQ